MSKTIETFPSGSKSTRPLYNWEDWEDGQIHELVSSKHSPDYDFDVPVESMRAMAYTYAGKKGLVVRTAKTEVGIALQFSPLVDPLEPDAFFPFDPPTKYLDGRIVRG
jgi:hypothetical protein